jgi:hypothetical protein
MPYTISYRLLVGSGTREALTAAEAVEDYRELKLAGAALIAVRDETGRIFTLEELLSAPITPQSPKARPDA